MEEKLQQSTEWTSTSTPSSSEAGADQNNEVAAITKLASQVEEQVMCSFRSSSHRRNYINVATYFFAVQRQLRLQDAKLVEAKAARIKEWVTNKLRDLEAQNQHLREQNDKCNQQLELLRKHMAQLSAGRSAESSVTDSSTSPVARSTSLSRANSAEATQ